MLDNSLQENYLEMVDVQSDYFQMSDDIVDESEGIAFGPKFQACCYNTGDEVMSEDAVKSGTLMYLRHEHFLS